MEINPTKNILKLMAGAALAAWISTAPHAHAATLTYSGTVSSTLTDWTQDLNITKFDAGLGTLTSVELILTTTGSTSITVTNLGGSASSGSVRTELLVSLTDPSDFLAGFNPFIDLLVPSAAQNYSLASGDSIVLGPFSRSGSSGAQDFTDSNILSEFTGIGVITLTGNAHAQTVQSNSGGNTATSQTTAANLGVTVIYNYDAVPEPGTYALLSLGLGFGAVAYIRRRRAVRA